MNNLLTNPFYIGRLRWKDLEVAGAHEPLVSTDLFNRVQGVLKKRFKDPGAKGSVNGFPLRGLAICAACRGHMTAGYQRVRWGYYRCARRGYNRALCSASKYCPSTLAHRAIEEVCGKLRLPSATLESILKAARRLVEERMADSRQRTNSLRMRQAKLMERDMRLTEGFVAGDVSSNAYKSTATKLKTDLRELETELALLQRTPSELMTRVAHMLQRATTIWELHEQLNEPRQIELLHAVFHKIVLDETGLVGFTLRPPFDVIFKSRLSATASSPQSPGNSPATSDIRQIAKEIVHRAIENPQTELDATTEAA